MDAGLDSRPTTSETVRRQVLQIEREGQKTACVLKEGGQIFVSNFLAANIRPGDEMELPLSFDSPEAGTEIYVHKNSASPRTRDVYQVPIGYAAL